MSFIFLVIFFLIMEPFHNYTEAEHTVSLRRPRKIVERICPCSGEGTMATASPAASLRD